MLVLVLMGWQVRVAIGTQFYCISEPEAHIDL